MIGIQYPISDSLMILFISITRDILSGIHVDMRSGPLFFCCLDFCSQTSGGCPCQKSEGISEDPKTDATTNVTQPQSDKSGLITVQKEILQCNL